MIEKHGNKIWFKFDLHEKNIIITMWEFQFENQECAISILRLIFNAQIIANKKNSNNLNLKNST